MFPSVLDAHARHLLFPSLIELFDDARSRCEVDAGGVERMAGWLVGW